MRSFDITGNEFSIKPLPGFSVDEAASRLSELLKRRGFGVLGDISFDRVLKEKTGAQVEPIRLLEVCKPPFALKAIESDRLLAQAMPCRITLFGEEKGVSVSLYRPTAAMKMVAGKSEDIASAVESELLEAIDELGRAGVEAK